MQIAAKDRTFKLQKVEMESAMHSFSTAGYSF